MHTQRETPLAAALRDAIGGRAARARPRKIDHEDRLVVLAEDGERNVPGLRVVKDSVFVLVDLLERGREASPPRFEELKSTL